MNTRPHCSKSRPTGTGGQQMPGSTTASWRIAYAASPPNAGFRTRRKSYLISPGGTIPEPIVSVADLLSDDRRDARVGLLGDPRAACAYDAAANHQALATGALSPCRSRARNPEPRVPAGSRRAPIDAGLANASDTSHISDVLDSHPILSDLTAAIAPCGTKGRRETVMG